MKAALYSVETKTEAWVEAAKKSYLAKINPFCPFELISIKSPAMDRGDAESKRFVEGERLLKQLKATDFVILFDEGGKEFASSEVFASQMLKGLERSPPRLVFVIGGAFGVSMELRQRANAVWSLSALTMNHWVAQIMALEQIYRAFTIIKRIPYHNR